MTEGSYDSDANCRRWPEARGQFSAGTLEFETTDPIRSSQYAPTPTATRRLYVRAWYPAGDVTGCSRRPYFTESEADIVPAKTLELLRQPADALRTAPRLLTSSWIEAPPASGRFPVVVFNHGYLSYPAQHTALFEHLAVNGSVVLSVGHPWESGGIVYPNGDIASASPRILEDMMRIAQALGAMEAYAAPTLGAQLAALREYVKMMRTTSAGRLAPVWRDDVYFVLDQLEDDAIPAASAVAAIIDHERRAYMGKSFGAYIAGMLAQGDPRSRGVVHLDGGLWSYELADTELRTPFLTLGSDVWQDFRNTTELPHGMDPSVREPLGPRTPAAADLAYEVIARAGLRIDGYRFVVPGIRHSGISDLPELAGASVLRVKLGTEAALSTFTAIQNDVVSGFIDRHVKGISSDYPASVLAAHPEIIVQDLGWLRERAQAERLPVTSEDAPLATSRAVAHSIVHVALIVRDYDEAIAFYTQKLGFTLLDDTYQPEQNKRWVVVAPKGSSGTTLLLARASTPEQELFVGNQAGGRVFLFLSTDDFWRDYHRMIADGIHFVRPASSAPYGTVAVFEDLYGNRWDLVQYLSRTHGSAASGE